MNDLEIHQHQAISKQRMAPHSPLVSQLTLARIHFRIRNIHPPKRRCLTTRQCIHSLRRHHKLSQSRIYRNDTDCRATIGEQVAFPTVGIVQSSTVGAPPM